MNKLISEFRELSRYASKHPEFVQGGGGNCSVKSNGKMIIKASGYFLKDISDTKGFVIINLKNKRVVKNKNLQPSLETAIHFLLGKYIIHTHPILIGAMVCSKEGKYLFRKLFHGNPYFWIKFARPGKNLAHVVRNTIKKHKIDINTNLVLFLENHGVFISSDNKRECITLHQQIIKKLRGFFKPNLNNNPPNQGFNQNYYLTPDHIVYLSVSKKQLSRKNKRAITEINDFTNKVKRLIKSRKLQIQYLSKKDCEFIINMKEEKYRQRLK